MSEELEIIEGDGVAEVLKDDPVYQMSGNIWDGGDGAVMQKIDTSRMSIDFTILTRGKEPNRQGNVVDILPDGNLGAGMVTKEWETNPVVLLDHGMGFPLAVGSAAETFGAAPVIRASKTKLQSTAFLSQSLQMARDLFALYDEGHMRAVSIGFHPIKLMSLGRPAQARLADGVEPAWYARRHNVRFTEALMLEYSLTAIGADAGALRQSYESGKIAGEHYDPQLNPWLKMHMSPKQTQGRGFDPADLSPGSLVLVLPNGTAQERCDAMLQSLPAPVVQVLEERGLQLESEEETAVDETPAETDTETTPVVEGEGTEEPSGEIAPSTETLAGETTEEPAAETPADETPVAGVDGEAGDGTNQTHKPTLKQRLAQSLREQDASRGIAERVNQRLERELDGLEDAKAETQKALERITGILPG